MLDRYTGKKFNNLLVISYSHTIKIKLKKVKHYYNVLCDCGNTKITSSDSLMGGTKTCGCLRVTNGKKWTESHRLEKDQAAFNRIYKRYQQNAKIKNRCFTLTPIEFKSLLIKDCFYCGDPPSESKNKTWDSFKYNGIDRVENNIGYCIENCVTCCATCNKMKLALTEDEFKNKIIKIYKKLYDPR